MVWTYVSIDIKFSIKLGFFSGNCIFCKIQTILWSSSDNISTLTTTTYHIPWGKQVNIFATQFPYTFKIVAIKKRNSQPHAAKLNYLKFQQYTNLFIICMLWRVSSELYDAGFTPYLNEFANLYIKHIYKFKTCIVHTIPILMPKWVTDNMSMCMCVCVCIALYME